MFKLILGIIIIGFALYTLQGCSSVFGPVFANIIGDLISKIILIVLVPIVVILFVWGLIKVIKHSGSRRIVHTYKTPDLPETIRPISGSFICNACGGTTILKDEIHPNATCCYCGSKLEDLEQLIKSRYTELDQEKTRIMQYAQKSFEEDENLN